MSLGLMLGLGGFALTTIGAYKQAEQQAAQAKYQAKVQAMNLDFNAQTAEMNAKLALYNTYNQAQALENQAMLVTQQHAQAMANTKAAQASSGVYSDSASSFEIRSTQEFAKVLDLTNMNLAKTNLLTQGMSTNTALRAEAMVNRANAKATRDVASQINPSAVGGWTAIGTAAGFAMQAGLTSWFAGQQTAQSNPGIHQITISSLGSK